MTLKKVALVVVAIVFALSINLVVLGHEGISPSFMHPTPKPNCDLFHVGTTTVEVTYPADIVVDRGQSSVVTLYWKDDPGLKDGNAMYVLGISDRATGYETADKIVRNAGKDGPGPLYNKKTTFNGLEAALATPSPGYYYYEIPFGNVVINLEYNPRDLPPDERKLTDEMVKGIAFKAVSENLKYARVESCY
jgi:hypothetical protein